MTEVPGLLQAADLPMDPDDIAHGADFGPMFTRADAEPVGESEGDETEEPQDEVLLDLDSRAREDFVGLMRLGYLEDTCTIAGHRFLLRTPTHDARLERGNLHREHLGSMNTEPMWRLITVAAYCMEIDDVPAPEPLNPKSAGVTDRLRWLKQTVFSSVMIEKLFMETLLIDARERAVVEYLDGQSKA